MERPDAWDQPTDPAPPARARRVVLRAPETAPETNGRAAPAASPAVIRPVAAPDGSRQAPSAAEALDDGPAVIHPVAAPPPLTRLLPTPGPHRRSRSQSAPRVRRRAPAFMIGGLLGLIGGAAGLLLLLIIAPHHTLLPQIPSFTNPDITISISESYLNSQAQEELKTTHPIVLPYVTVTNLELDLLPNNRMRLQPTFHAAIIDVAATVENNVRLENDQLVLQMNSDPKIQDIPIPLDLLPFNLPDQVRQAVNQINNDLLSSEINRQISAGFGSSQFRITSITTDDYSITFKLRRK